MAVELMDKAGNVRVIAIANVKTFRGEKDLHQHYYDHLVNIPQIITARAMDEDNNNLEESTPQLSSAT